MATRAGSKVVAEMLAHLEPPMPVVDHDGDSKVAAFYANRSVLITGATGFIGKALIEKLIRSCPDVKRIFILVREKRGKSVQERITELIKSPFFDRIRQSHGGSSRVLEEKLCAIRGDISQAKFGIAREDMQLLSDECSIVINSAATIRFSEPIDNAVRNNIYSVSQLVEFCNELAHLEALIHLSTAYSNCHKRDSIDEIFYEPPMRGDQIQKNVETLREIQSKIHVYPGLASDESSSNIDGSHRDACEPQRFYKDCPRFVTSGDANNSTGGGGDVHKHSAAGGPGYDLLDEFTRIALRRSNRPNTYTFTKAIGESYLLDKMRARPDRYLGDKIPVAIVRPSIVTAAWREPIVGWVDNPNGTTGGILGMYIGALQAVPGDGSLVFDLVPVDMVANMILSVGWFLVDQSSNRRATPDKSKASASAMKIQHDQGVYLFNFVSGARNPMLGNQCIKLIDKLAYKYPSKHMVRLPSSYFIRAGQLFDWFDLLNHKLPAYMTDLIKSKFGFQRLEARSSSLVGYTRIRQALDMLAPFSSNQWKFSDTNTRALYESLHESDKQVFHFDVASIDWLKYNRAYILGSRIHLLGDKPENVPAALGRLQRRRALYWIAIGSLIVLAYCVFLHNLI